MGKHVSAPSSKKQDDLLLWIGGGAVAIIGGAWLFIMQPWGGSSDSAAPPPIIASATPTLPAPQVAEPVSGTLETTLDNPLRMAQLAYDAGMLVEPEEYSAWTLYARVVKEDPANGAALEGLTKVADDLVRRGKTALEQGRFDDARKTIERIRAVLPEHPGAKALAATIFPEAAPQVPHAIEKPPPIETPHVARVDVQPAAPAKPAVDPMVQASAAFDKAMAAGRLLTPTNESAKHFVAVLVAGDSDHPLTARARETLSRELLSRAAQSIEALDAEAAAIWIDEAASIGYDKTGVDQARNALIEHRVAMESAKLVPASELSVVTYVPPVYPARALDRGIEGWVDLQFTVGIDGKTHDIEVADASNENQFKREAIAAVEQWVFEPRIFMNRAIEQRSYTRIRFVQ